MSAVELDVNDRHELKTVGNPTLKTTGKSDLTLSAVPEDGPDPVGAPAARSEIERERDPDIVTEAELRLMWGDR